VQVMSEISIYSSNWHIPIEIQIVRPFCLMPATSQPKFHVGAKRLSWELEFLKCDDFHKLITKIAERNCVPASRACFVMLAEN
jgi:hypothetical protein